MSKERDGVILNFWVTDAEEQPLEKGMSSTARIIGGYAAGATKDFQDEQMVLKGINFDYLRSNQGVVNWDHIRRMVIGRPLFVGMLEKGLYVKGVLSKKSDYPNASHADVKKALEQADYAWDYVLRHKANPSGIPPLAWSIEGKTVSARNGTIYKSLATAVALTDKAINPHDCTVQALAKSFRETEDRETREMIDSNEFDPADIDSHHKYMLFCKSINLNTEQAEILYRKIRRL